MLTCAPSAAAEMAVVLDLATLVRRGDAANRWLAAIAAARDGRLEICAD
jgi:hypothetical protein